MNNPHWKKFSFSNVGEVSNLLAWEALKGIHNISEDDLLDKARKVDATAPRFGFNFQSKGTLLKMTLREYFAENDMLRHLRRMVFVGHWEQFVRIISQVRQGLPNYIGPDGFFENLRCHPRDFKQLDYLTFTNNTYLVDKYDYDDVYVVSESGKVARLSAHSESEKWKPELSTAELWSIAGESWVDSCQNCVDIRELFVLPIQD